VERLFSLLALVILSINTYGQGYTAKVRHLSTKDGLLQRSVNYVFEDRSGFIWIAFDKGIQRFDGKNFKTWTAENSQGKISGATRIIEDNQGWLWLWNNELRDFAFLHTVTEEIKLRSEYLKDFNSNPIVSNEHWIMSNLFSSGPEKKLVFVTSSPPQVHYFDGREGFTSSNLKKLSSGEFVLWHIDSKNNLWVNGILHDGSKIFKINPSGDILDSISIPEGMKLAEVEEFNEKIIIHLVNTDAVRVRIIYSDTNFNQFESVNHSKMVDMKNGLIWSLENRNWNIYNNLEMKEPIIHLNSSKHHKSLFQLVQTLFHDSKERTWVISSWGLSVVELHQNPFVVFLKKEEKEQDMNSIRGIWSDGNNLCANVEFKGFIFKPKQAKPQWLQKYPSNRYGYSGKPILAQDNGTLLNGTAYSIDIIKPNNSPATYDQFIKSNWPECGLIWSLYQDPQNNLWIGYARGIGFKPKTSSEIMLFKRPIKWQNENIDWSIYSILPSDGYLWVCSNAYLYRFDPKEKKFTDRYGLIEKGKNHLPARSFFSIHEDKSGILWLGTDKGLIQWDTKSRTFQLFNKESGLGDETIYAIIEDDQNHLWLSSNEGIISFNKKTHATRTYLQEDGISHNEFNRTSYFKDKNGRIYFGGLNGITSFHPADLEELNKYESSGVHISSFEVFDKKEGKLIDKASNIRKTKTIVLQPQDQFFRLGISMLDYVNNDKVSYAWKLVGVYDQWNYQKQDLIQLNKLPYGRHELIVKGKSAKSGWLANELHIVVKVLKPFYLKTWFLILITAVILFSIISFFWFRTRRLKEAKVHLEKEVEKATLKIKKDKTLIEKQAEELRQLDKVKTRFFTNVSHELRTPLTLIMGPIENLLNKEEALSKNAANTLSISLTNAKKLKSRVDEILDLSKLDVGKLQLQPQAINIKTFAKQIIHSFIPAAQIREITFDFKSKIKEDLNLLVDLKQMEKVLSNLLSNALKYSPNKGKISILLNQQGDLYQFIVSDQGIGVPFHEKENIFNRFHQSDDGKLRGGTGVGLALSRDLAQLMEGDIQVIHNPSEVGAQFSFTFKASATANSEIKEISSKEENTIHKTKFDIETEFGGRPSVLVVEDNLEIRAYIKGLLQSKCKILEAGDGIEALKLLETNSIDLITSDVMMPNMDGFTFLTKIKEDEQYKSIPVIMLTSLAEDEKKLEALEAGVDDYIIKPFYPRELFARIQSILKNLKVRKLESESISEESSETDENEEWLKRLKLVIHDHLHKSSLTKEELAEYLNTTERTLNRRLKKLIGMSIAPYLKELRLNKALKYLQTKKYLTIKEVTNAVGFARPDYFSNEFYKRYGKYPNEYLK